MWVHFYNATLEPEVKRIVRSTQARAASENPVLYKNYYITHTRARAHIHTHTRISKMAQ